MLPKPELKYGYSKKQIEQICKERNILEAKFWKAFGVNTVCDDGNGNTCYYRCDVEKALYSLGCSDGKWHQWD